MARADEIAELTRSGLFERLKAAVLAAGGNKVVADASGVPISTLNAYLAGTMMPSIAKLARIADACGVTLDHIVSGAPQGEADTVSGITRGRLLVRKLEFRVSAGGGGAVVVDEEGNRVPFPREILDELRLRPDNARLLTAVGDSMRPTIDDGELLLVDVRATEIVEGKIYVFTVGEDMLVKRLRRRGGKLFMRSDNRDLYPDEEEVPTVEPVRIIGRVKWVGKSL